nr:hypothetical protein [Streptomyces sp. gCLA4]
MDPGDIDVVFIVNGIEFDALPPQEKAIVTLFATGSRGASWHNLRVDAYMIPWKAYPEPDFTDREQVEYFMSRGHWDDFWLRARSGPKGAPIVPEDAVAKRGYLEVPYDAYV